MERGAGADRMSLTTVKCAFEFAMADVLSADDREEFWLRMLAYMVKDVGGHTLYWHVPMKVPDITLKRRQGDLFARLRAEGMKQRQIADATGCSQSTVCRGLDLIQPSAVSESAA